MGAQELPLSLTGQEAEVLALGPAGHLQLRPGGDLAHLGLGQLGERKAQAGQGSGAQRREHVGLVLRVIGGAGQQRARAVVGDPRVMARDEPRRPQAVGQGDHRVDAQLAVAEDAGVGGAPLRVAAQERANHAGAELTLEVQRQMRDAERVGHPAGPEYRLGRAAAALPVGAHVGPELEGHRHRIAPGLPLAQGGDRRVDAAAECDEDPLTIGGRIGKPQVRPGEPGQRAVESIRREHGGVTMGRRKPAELGLDLVRSDPGGLQHRGSVGQLGRRRGRGRARGAPLAVEADLVDPSISDDERQPNQVAARRSARRAAERPVRDGPAPRAVLEVLLKKIPIHGAKIRRLQPAVFRPGLVTRVA